LSPDYYSKLSEKVRVSQLAHIHTNADRRNNKWKILECIFQFEPQGISTKELEENTGLNHDTISNHCKELVLEGRITKKNKKAKYHLTEKAYDEPIVRAWLFKKIMENIRKWNIPFDEENVFCNVNKGHGEEDNYNKRILFSFANRIGTFIIYAMIEAIKLGSWTAEIPGKTMTADLSGSKDKLALEWIKNVIDPIDLFSEFLELPFREINFHLKHSIDIGSSLSVDVRDRNGNPTTKRQWKKTEAQSLKRSAHQPDKASFEKLVKVFRDIYPRQFTQLEEFKDSLDGVIK
jgi:predicted transcriptional regulator